MKELLWAVGLVSLATFLSVVSHAAELNLENASIEVGFSENDEPEPHMLVVFKNDGAKVFQLIEKSRSQDRRIASEPSNVPDEKEGKPMSSDLFRKRLSDVVESRGFFSVPPVRLKGRCKDRYVLRVSVDGKFRERRGCSNQGNDPFAQFAQNMFRDSFQFYNHK